MKLRQLGPSDLHLTPVGLGTWAMGGGDWKFGWGPQDDALSIRTIHEALDLGIKTNSINRRRHRAAKKNPEKATT